MIPKYSTLQHRSRYAVESAPPKNRVTAGVAAVDLYENKLGQHDRALSVLIALHQAKPLSFREKKMLERARYLLVSELAMARNCEESKIEELLTGALAKCKLRFPEASEFQA